MKHCPSCKETKPTGKFSKASKRYDGLQSHCKSCRSERRKADYLKNKDREIELSKIWAENNPEAIKAKAVKHRRSEHGGAYYNNKNAKHRAMKLSATPV